MSNDALQKLFRLLPRPANAPPTEPLTRPAGAKFGVYPLGAEDVVMSLATLNKIFVMLEHGTAEERRLMVTHLRASHGAYFVE